MPLQTKLRKGKLQIEDFRRQLDKLKILESREKIISDESISQLEQQCASHQKIESECALAKAKSLKMLQIFLQCNQRILDPSQHHDAWKLVSVHILRKPSTSVQDHVTESLKTLKSATTPSHPSQFTSIQKTSIKPGFDLRRRDSKKLTYIDEDLTTAGHSTAVGKRLSRQDTRKGLTASNDQIDSQFKNSSSGGLQDSGKNENLKTEDDVKVQSNKQPLDRKRVDHHTGDAASEPIRLSSTGEQSLLEQVQKPDAAKSRQESAEPSILKMKIKVPALRLDGGLRLSPKNMLRNLESNGSIKTLKEDNRRSLEPTASVKYVKDDSRQNINIRNSSFRMSVKAPTELPAIEVAHVARTDVNAKLTNASPKANEPDLKTIESSLVNLMENIAANGKGSQEQTVDSNNTKQADVFDSILEAESFIKSAEKASVAFASSTDLMEFNDEEFDLGKVERMMNMHKTRVSRSRDEQLKLLDALSSEFEGLD